jgi:hypothetical protein
MEFRKPDHIATTYVGEECLVLDGATGSCHILNETAGWLLSICSNFVTLDDALDLAQKRYAVDQGIDLRQQVQQVLLDMETRGIVQVHREV